VQTQLDDTGGNMTRQKLLIVDDDTDLRETLEHLFGNDYEVHMAADGLEALDQAQTVQPDLILLDIMMPRMDGFQTCLRLRQNVSTKHIPIIFLTTKTEPQSETFGLDLGADDFVTKPFNIDVLKARVRKRLNGATPGAMEETTELGDYTVYWERQEATHGEERIFLTTKESNLLKLFVQSSGKVLSREAILERVWSDTFITDRTIDSHVKELRKKIPPLVTLLKTVYGSGYRLDI